MDLLHKTRSEFLGILAIGMRQQYRYDGEQHIKPLSRLFFHTFVLNFANNK